MKQTETQEKVEALHNLLSQDSTTLEKFQSVTKLARGINPQIDKALDQASETLGKIENLSKGEIIELSVDVLPEDDEKQKKRKKAIILFIKYYKELKSEVERVKTEFEKNKNQDSKSVNQHISTVGRIATFAKGPFGILTVVAVIIVAAGGVLWSQKSPSNTSNQILPSLSPSPSLSLSQSPTTTQKIKGIIFNGQKIPLTELAVRSGPDCDSPHYHAQNQTSIKTLDGTTVLDPGACAFGKTKETQVVEF